MSVKTYITPSLSYVPLAETIEVTAKRENLYIGIPKEDYFDENRILGESSNPEETYIREIMPAKILLNMKYIANPSCKHDFKIMWLTFNKIFFG